MQTAHFWVQFSIKESFLFTGFTIYLIEFFISRYSFCHDIRNYHKMVYHDNHDIQYIYCTITTHFFYGWAGFFGLDFTSFIIVHCNAGIFPLIVVVTLSYFLYSCRNMQYLTCVSSILLFKFILYCTCDQYGKQLWVYVYFVQDTYVWYHVVLSPQ